jgi:hypothetical protein
MSLSAAIARVQEIQTAFAPSDAAAVAHMSAVTGGAAAPGTTAPVTAVASGSGSFSNVLQNTLAGSGAPATTGVAGSAPLGGVTPMFGGATTPGGQIVALAQAEVGQAEQPPGSNDSPRIAVYREATAGSGVGPWCAYFTSWLGQQAGMPLGESGQGFGRVDDVYAWAQSVGRAVPNGSGAVPNPGDLIVWDEHIGIVEQVLPDGRVQTIEGNSSDKVSRNVHDAGSALGYVRMS